LPTSSKGQYLPTAAQQERELLLQRMQAGYERFLSVVKAGRKLSSQEVQPVAEGRIFSGKQAMAGRLVDVLSGVVRKVVGMIPGVVWALCLEGDVLARMDEEPVAL
jgi:ClpP class serine protease